MRTGDERRTLYPAIEPYAHGMLEVGDGQRLYWETSGNPDGKPTVFLHGGPGGGTSAFHRQFFDPTAYRIVLVDQRGCGRSLPHVADGADLSVNTTAHLVADLELLREFLGIEVWQVFGGSWGSTLALAYAQAYPQRVTELVLRGIFLLRRKEIDWYYNGAAGYIYPEQWEQFLAPVPESERATDLVEAYHRLLHHPDPAVAGAAAIAWSEWEAATSSLLPRPERIAESTEPRFALAFARIENHYFRNAGFFPENALLDGIDRIRHIPAVIVQGRHDIVCPATSAWDLHRAWPDSQLHIVPDAGHAANEPGITHHLVEATDAFRRHAETGAERDHPGSGEPRNRATVTSAGDALGAILRRYIAMLFDNEQAVRTNEPDAVHQMRVAARRLRSVLRSYRPLLRRGPVEQLRGELRWLGEVLGEARDAEVRAERLSDALSELAAEQIRGPVVERLVHAQQARYAGCLTAAIAQLDSARYRALCQQLSQFADAPPLRKKARHPAVKLFPQVLDKQQQRLRRLAAEAETVPEPDRISALHEVRKAAKQLRYAATADAEIIGPAASAKAKQAKHIQTVLGNHRDAVEAARWIAEATQQARTAGEDLTTYSLLLKAENRAAETALARYRESAIPGK